MKTSEKLSSRVLNFQKDAAPLSEVIPYLHEIAPGYLLLKDGSIMCAYQYAGIDIEKSSLLDQVEACNLFDMAIKDFDSSVNIWTLTHRRKIKKQERKIMPDMYSQILSDSWADLLDRTGLFRNKNYFFIQVKAITGAGDLIKRQSQKNLNENKSFFSSIIQGIRYSMDYESRLFSEIEEIQALIEKAKEYTRKFENGAQGLGLLKLEGDSLIGVLNQSVSPSSDGEPISLNSNSFIDSRIGNARIEVNSSAIRFLASQEKYAVVLSAKDFPEFGSGPINAIAFLPVDMTISQSMQFWDYDKSEAFISGQRNYFEQAMKPVTVALKEWAMGYELNQNDKEKESSFYDSNDALTNLANNRAAGLYNLTIVVYGDTEEQAIESAKMVEEVLTQQKMQMYRERMHSFGAFAGTIPGQYNEPARWYFFLGRNYTDFALLFMPSEGDYINNHLSEEIGIIHPNLVTLPTSFLSPFNFNFHVGKLGHTMMIGPTRGGKSVFMNFLISMFRQYDQAQIFIFDKDSTCKIPTFMQYGANIDPSSSEVKINPFRLVDMPQGKEFLVNWVEILITYRGYKMTPQDDKDLWKAIDIASTSLSRDVLKLESLKSFLPPHLQLNLESWIGNGQNSNYFNNIEDNFDLSDITTMDIGKLFEMNLSAGLAFMSYVFFKIEQRLNGRPTIIYIEELWFPMKHPAFAAKFENWVRTLGKKNVILLFSTQNLQELSESDSFNVLLGSIPTKIFVPNIAATSPAEAALYKQFGLNDDEITIISKMTRNAQYYIKRQEDQHTVTVRLTKEILAIVNSDKSSLNLLDAIIADDSLYDKRHEYFYRQIAR